MRLESPACRNLGGRHCEWSEAKRKGPRTWAPFTSHHPLPPKRPFKEKLIDTVQMARYVHKPNKFIFLGNMAACKHYIILLLYCFTHYSVLLCCMNKNKIFSG